MVYESDGQERLLTGHTGRMFLLLTIILVFLQLARRMLPPLLPIILDDLAITAFQAGMALTVLRVARASMEYPGGRLADQLSRTTVLLGCLGIVIVGVVALALSVSYGIFLIAVTVFGIGVGFYNPASRALLSDIFHEKRGRAFGLHMLGNEVSGILAAGVVIVIVSRTTWRGAFVPLALLLVVLLVVLYRLSREPIELKSVNLEVRRTGLRLLRDPVLRRVVIVYMLFNVASSGMISFLPTFLIEVHNFSFGFASSAFALVYAVGIVAKPVSGYLSDWFPRPPVAGGCLIIAGAGLLLLVTAPTETAAIGGVILYALGQRGVAPALQAFLMDRFPDESMGGDLGAFRTIYMLVGSFGPGYTGLIASTFGFVPAFVSLSIFLVVGGLILFWFTHFGWPASRK